MDVTFDDNNYPGTNDSEEKYPLAFENIDEESQSGEESQPNEESKNR